MINNTLVPYTDRGTELEGFLAYDPKLQNRPGVILCHAWRGRDDFVCEKATEIASWGYTAFALDLYGKGVLGTTKEENEALMTPFMKDRAMLLSRLQLSLKAFQNQNIADNTKIAVMGFCFGGLCALDFARGGSDIKGAISVHGLLTAPEKTSPSTIKAKVLALHGHDDPMVPPKDVTAFETEMTSRKADWQIHMYGNTMHAFTNPIANDPAFGTVYNPVAAKRAWQAIRNFFADCFE